MQLDNFIKSLSNDTPPPNVSVYLKALWFEKNGDWEKAHDLVQDIPEKNASWVHAYLHRKEGDQWNADYWYAKAGKPTATVSLDEEWKNMVQELLHQR